MNFTRKPTKIGIVVTLKYFNSPSKIENTRMEQYAEPKRKDFQNRSFAGKWKITNLAVFGNMFAFLQAQNSPSHSWRGLSVDFLLSLLTILYWTVFLFIHRMMTKDRVWFKLSVFLSSASAWCPELKSYIDAHHVPIASVPVFMGAIAPIPVARATSVLDIPVRVYPNRRNQLCNGRGGEWIGGAISLMYVFQCSYL